jgi:signal transduction histidine kinase
VKIRTQFYILLSGIILIPLVAFCAIKSIGYFRSPDRLLIPGTGSAPQEKKPFPDSEMKHIHGFVRRLPPSVQVVIMDKNRRVLYSGFEEISEGENLSPAKTVELLNGGGGRYVFQIDYNFGRFFENADVPSRRKESFKNMIMISRMDRNLKPPPNRFEELTRAVAAVFVALFSFCAVVITLITRSLTRSVTSLEKATRLIAEGNLDAAVDMKGSSEIASLARSLNTMRQSLKESAIRRGRFIMGVSHDLRTPLSLIKGYTEALADDVADSPEMRQKSLEIIGDKIDSLQEMIDDLINYVKLDSGEWRGSLEEREIKPVLVDYANRLALDARLLNRKVESRIDIPDRLPDGKALVVPFDERLFVRALENLCGNALRYTDAGGAVTIAAELADGKNHPAP